MKKISYSFYEEVEPKKFLHYNSFSNQFLLLNQKKHDELENFPESNLEKNDLSFYEILTKGKFLVPDDFDEYEVTMYAKRQMRFNSTLYHIMVNTTLDCNLNCWYCYENRIAGSKLEKNTIEAIEKNIDLEYKNIPYKTLKVSFFGGEPFLHFDGIRAILDYAKEFCKDKDIELIADFTTNATLITKAHIDYLKDMECHFQITLDGDRKTHNLIKKDATNSIDSYQKTIEALQLIENSIPKRWLAVRINFDNHTLHKIDEIISAITFLNRKHCYVILKKVWQIPTEKIDKELLFDAIQKFFNEKFLLDYYIMPKGHICFAERCREVLFNYDGKVFKCSTISSFDDDNSLGKLNYDTGEIRWDMNKIASWTKDILPDYCTKCEWLPACYGPCNKQLLAHQNERICTFDAMNMTRKEYLIYIFKYHLLKNELARSTTANQE